MKRIFVFAVIIFGFMTCLCDEETVSQYRDSISAESAESASLKVHHNDSIPSIMRKPKLEDHNDVRYKNPIVPKISKSKNSISIICYKNGLCLVKDTRTIKTSPGINEVVFEDLYAGLIKESVSFRTPKKGKISILNYKFDKENFSRINLLSSSVGNNVFYHLDNSNKLENGKLINITNEKDGTYAVINNDNKCFFVPINHCIAVDEKVKNHLKKNSLNLTFESEDSDDIEVEINYLTKDISWKHICIIDVFEKLDRVDIFSQALLNNNTDFNLENIKVAFDSSSPDFSKVNSLDGSVIAGIENNISGYIYSNIIKKNSDFICMLRSAKELKPQLKYSVKITDMMLSNDLVKDLSVENLLAFEDIKKMGIDIDFKDNNALIFQRRNNERSFLGLQSLSSMKRDKDLVFSIGIAHDIFAQVQQTDFKRLSEKQSEYGVRVTVQNNKEMDSTVLIVIDTSSQWKIIKKNFDMLKSDKPTWSLLLKPKETKELHFRMRVNK